MQSQDIYSKETLEELEKRNKAILSALGSCNKDIKKIAFNLYWIYQSKAYKAMGCETIIDYAQQKFDIEKSTTYNYINLVEYFGARDKEGNLTLKDLKPEYKDYSYSKLVLLLNVPLLELSSLDISPDMSVRDIKKAIKKNHASESKIDDNEVVVPDSELDQDADISDQEEEDKNLDSKIDKSEPDSISDALCVLDGCITLREFIDGLKPELFDRFEGSFDVFMAVHPDLDPDQVYIEINLVSNK